MTRIEELKSQISWMEEDLRNLKEELAELDVSARTVSSEVSKDTIFTELQYYKELVENKCSMDISEIDWDVLIRMAEDCSTTKTFCNLGETEVGQELLSTPQAGCICKGFYQPVNCPVHGKKNEVQ